MSNDCGGGDGSDSPFTPRVRMPEDGPLRQRFDELREKFASSFDGEEPSVYLRVPGRVNLIGEHIDYCGYSVCPMAIQQDILVAAKADPSSQHNFLELVNLDSSKYCDHVFPNTTFKIDLKLNGWASYFLCGLKGALERMKMDNPSPLKIAVSGNIPPGSGLSSSSALVSAAFLVTTYLNGIQLSKSELATLSARSEQYIGTVGGGMDQAIAFLATKGCAKHIEFSPIRTEDLSLPDDAVFVIGHSMVTKNKAASADFNTRVIECRLAAQILAKKNMLNWQSMLRLVDVQNSLKASLNQLISLVQESFHEHPYTKQEICNELGVTEEELNKMSLTPNTIHVNQFKLRQRALHVFQEAWRVSEFCKGCKLGWDLERLGSLMTESHNSLRSLYECSHPSLDNLVEICLSSGALGARLTGAGWGGCVVAMTTKDRVSGFVESVKEQFYSTESENIDALIFPTESNQGAEIYLPQNQFDSN